MAPEQIDHLRTLALIASAPVAVVMFFGSYWLYKTKRTSAMYRGVAALLILSCWLVAYLVDRTLHIFAVISSAGIAAFYFGRVRAIDKHPEAFGFPEPQRTPAE